jgi:hypothetical protein
MKALRLIMLVTGAVAALFPVVALAQGSGLSEPGGVDLANLFGWAAADPPDWGRGALFAGLGLAGALVTVFGLIGGVVSGTAGKAKIEADVEQLKRWSGRLEELMMASSPDAAAIEAIQKATDTFRDDLARERWRQFACAAALYALLGAFFASMLAQDIVQAIVTGAGWTAVVGSLGLKTDFKERKLEKDAVLERTLVRAHELEQKLREQDSWSEDWGFEDFDALEGDGKVALAL